MISESELPADVIAELEANRELGAMKLLQKHEGIGMAAAKDRIDAYLETHQPSILPGGAEPGDRSAQLTFVALVIAALYGLFQLLF